MADINPAIPMGMNYGTSAFIQSADIRKSLAAADSVNLETAIKLEEKRKYNTAQNIIKRHLKDDGTLDPIGATKELYAFSPEHADMFVKEHAAHLDNVLKGMVTQGHTEDYPKARAFLETQRGGQQQAPVAPAAPVVPTPAPAQPDPTLEQEQSATTFLNPEAPNPFAGVQAPPPQQPVAPMAPPAPETQTLGQMVAPQAPVAQAAPGAPTIPSYAEKYLQYTLNPTREQYAQIEPELEAKQGGVAASMYRAALAPGKGDLTPNQKVKQRQWTETQWQALDKRTNEMQASSRSGLGSAGIANIRSARALSTILDPNIVLDTYTLNLINTDIQGIMKGGAPDEIQLKEGYQNLQTWLGSLWQKISAQPALLTLPEVQSQFINILTGLQDIDNQIIDKNLGVQKVVFKKILGEDPERAMEYFAALQETMANPTGGFGSNPPMKKKDKPAGTEKPGEEIGGLPVMKNRAEVEKLKSGTVFLFNGVKHTKK